MEFVEENDKKRDADVEEIKETIRRMYDLYNV